MRKRRMEQELNHPRFVGVRLSDIELELLDRKAEILGVSRSECLRKLLVEKEIVHRVEVVADMEELRSKGDRASSRSGRRYGRTAKSGGGIWKDWCEPESDRTVLQYGRGTFTGYGG